MDSKTPSNLTLRNTNMYEYTNQKFIEIAGRKIGPQYPPFVVAEIGINHEGDIKKARQMINDAKKAGAECVKFQAHVVEDEMIPEAGKVVPVNAKESIWDIIKRCSLTEKQDQELKQLTESLEMIYLSTPFSRAAADRLERLNVKAYKIGSGECNNYPLVEHVASFGKPIILSTGMNNLDSIKLAVDILERYHIPYAILHCTSMYPTPYEKVRLGALLELQATFPQAVIGLSDHSLGIYTCLGAVSLGASILEKHFTSDKNWPGPDVPISITPQELKELIQGSKAIFEARGGQKTILPEEQPTIDFAYACVVTIKDVKKGEKFSKDNIWVKRPGTGQIKAIEYRNVIGKTASRDIPRDSQLKYVDIQEYEK